MAKKTVFAILELGQPGTNGVRTETFRSVANSVDQAEVWITRQLLIKKREIKVLLLRAMKKKQIETDKPYPRLPADSPKPIFDASYHNTDERLQQYLAKLTEWEMNIELPHLEAVVKHRLQIEKEIKAYLKGLDINKIDVSDIYVTQTNNYVVKPVESA